LASSGDVEATEDRTRHGVVINDAALAYRGVILPIAGTSLMPHDELCRRSAGVKSARDGWPRRRRMGLQHAVDVALIRHAYTLSLTRTAA
jgi:hypothetical protein